jgi:hypothetical protein
VRVVGALGETADRAEGNTEMESMAVKKRAGRLVTGTVLSSLCDEGNPACCATYVYTTYIHARTYVHIYTYIYRIYMYPIRKSTIEVRLFIKMPL